MKLQGSYDSVIKMYLTKYNQVKIHFNRQGEIVKTEKEQNGLWQTDRNLCTLLNKLPKTSSI